MEGYHLNIYVPPDDRIEQALKFKKSFARIDIKHFMKILSSNRNSPSEYHFFYRKLLRVIRE